MEVTPGFEPGNQGFADPCLTTWLCHHRGHLYYMRIISKSPHLFLDFDAHTFVWASSGAGNEARTRYLHLGKVALYQMSYARGTRYILTDESHLVKHFHQFSLLAFSRASAVSSSKVPSGWFSSSPAVFSECAAAKAASSSVGSSRNSTRPTGPSAG